MGRKHFRVSVHIYAGALCLFQQHFQIPQIMAGNQNSRIFVHANLDLCNFRISVGLRIGFVQKRHALYSVFAGFQSEIYQVICSHGIVQCGGQSPLKESVCFFIFLQQSIGVFRVSG